MFDSWESVVALVVAILIAYGVVLWLGTIVWAYRDIRARTRDGWSQTISILLVVLFNLPGLFLYLILRPHETLTEAYERRMEAEALMRDLPEPPPACPTCHRQVANDFLLCPHCRTRLREPCASCHRPLELNWAACPYCAAPGPQTVGASAGQTARPAAAEAPPRPPSVEPRAQPAPKSGAPATQAGPPPASSKAPSAARLEPSERPTEGRAG